MKLMEYFVFQLSTGKHRIGFGSEESVIITLWAAHSVLYAVHKFKQSVVFVASREPLTFSLRGDARPMKFDAGRNGWFQYTNNLYFVKQIVFCSRMWSMQLVSFLYEYSQGLMATLSKLWIVPISP